jgi:hypothetical protein
MISSVEIDRYMSSFQLDLLRRKSCVYQEAENNTFWITKIEISEQFRFTLATFQDHQKFHSSNCL